MDIILCHKCSKELDSENEIYYEYWQPSHTSPNPYYYCVKCRYEDLEEIANGEKEGEQLLVFTNAKEIIQKNMVNELSKLVKKND